MDLLALVEAKFPKALDRPEIARGLKLTEWTARRLVELAESYHWLEVAEIIHDKHKAGYASRKEGIKKYKVTKLGEVALTFFRVTGQPAKPTPWLIQAPDIGNPAVIQSEIEKFKRKNRWNRPYHRELMKINDKVRNGLTI